MILLGCIILFIVFSIVEASGKDWELGQILSEHRTNRIISAIGRVSDEIKSSYEYVSREQIDYFERFHKDMEKEDEFQDQHGRWFRKRLIYSPEGQVIAEEVIGIER